MKHYAAKMATFVNPDKTVLWSFKNLFTAFHHMIGDLSIIPHDLTCGPKTMDNLLSYNACMLYKIMKIYNISTRPTMTIDEMKLNALTILHVKERINVPQMISFSFSQLSDSNLCLEIYKKLSQKQIDVNYLKAIIKIY